MKLVATTIHFASLVTLCNGSRVQRIRIKVNDDNEGKRGSSRSSVVEWLDVAGGRYEKESRFLGMVDFLSMSMSMSSHPPAVDDSPAPTMPQPSLPTATPTTSPPSPAPSLPDPPLPLPTATPTTLSPSPAPSVPDPSLPLPTSRPLKRSDAPSVEPTDFVSSEPTVSLPSPTAPPTESMGPTATPFVDISSEPTNTDISNEPTNTETIEPTGIGPSFSGCGETSYVYCPGISTCFIGSFISSTGGGKNGPWGWSIDLDGIALGKHDSLECDIYAGAGQCEFETKGARVGTFIITSENVLWELDQGIGLQDAHFYVGECGANDGGNHLSTGNCTVSDMAKSARSPGQYTLVAPNEGNFPQYLHEFGFDTSSDNLFQKGPWKQANYSTFPIGGTGRRFLSAHATVCSCDLSPDGCASSNIRTASNLGLGDKTASSSSTNGGFIIGGTAGVLLAAVLVAAFAVKRRLMTRSSASSASSSLYPGSDMADVPLSSYKSELPRYPRLEVEL